MKLVTNHLISFKCLSIPGFLEVLRLYPEFKETFSREIIHDLTYNLRDDFEADSPEESEVRDVFIFPLNLSHAFIVLNPFKYQNVLFFFFRMEPIQETFQESLV